MTIRGSIDGNVASTVLAARFVGGPHISAADQAKGRLNEWLAELAEASPYLFDLVCTDAARAICLLLCEPERHLAQLIEKIGRDVLAAQSEAEVMQLLRRAKSEAALLIALCGIGGVWPVMQVTAALTEFAVASVQAALRFVLREEANRHKILPPDPDRPEDGSGLM